MPTSDPQKGTGPSGIAALRRAIAAARGDVPGDLLLRGGRVIDVVHERIVRADVLIADAQIVAIGDGPFRADAVMDLPDTFIAPSLVDAHHHVESTLLLPAALARIVVPRGTGAIIADPHEIGNVLGAAGVEFMLAASAGLPIDFAYMVPSCVPASPFEHPGAVIGPEEVEALLRDGRVRGLAEMMNYPGVLEGDPDVLAKIVAARAAGRVVDGHAPSLRGRDLAAYAAAGITSDHECTTAEEAMERDAVGMLVQVREGSMARNLDTMIPLIRDGRLRHWCLCTDDILPGDLLRTGHIDALLARLVAAGVPPAKALRHATWVPARHYGLAGPACADGAGPSCPRGAILPGYRADCVVLEDLAGFRARAVLFGGRVVASDGRLTVDLPSPPAPPTGTVRPGPVDAGRFRVPAGDDPVPVIELVPAQIVTRRREVRVPARDGWWTFDPAVDLALVSCVERHHATGRLGVGLVRGFGFSAPGAIGTSVGHDAHNILIAGTNGADMAACVAALTETGGGCVVVRNGALVARLALPVAGLLSTDDAPRVLSDLEAAEAAAAALGCRIPSPFGMLSFLALSVIPEIRITDRGLLDVTRWSLLGDQAAGARA